MVNFEKIGREIFSLPGPIAHLPPPAFPTGHFTIPEPQNQETGKFNAVHERILKLKSIEMVSRVRNMSIMSSSLCRPLNPLLDTIPTEPFTTLELQSSSHDLFQLHEFWGSDYFEARKLWNGWSGDISESVHDHEAALDGWYAEHLEGY